MGVGPGKLAYVLDLEVMILWKDEGGAVRGEQDE